MRAGTLRDRVTIQRRDSYLGQWGHESAWRDVATVWAEVKATGGAEGFKDKGIDGRTGYVIRLRYRADVKSTDRMIYRGSVLDLVSVVDPDGRRRALECVCVLHGDGKDAA